MPKMDTLRQDIWSISISDEETKAIIKKVFSDFKYVFEPHGAVGWAGLQAYLMDHPSEISTISFETADPAKFPDQISTLIGLDPPLTLSMKSQIDKEEFIKAISLSYGQFKSFLQNNY
jgi:threonine synthase